MARANGLGIIPYFQLESGFLTGKGRHDSTPPETRPDEMEAVAPI